MKKKLKIAELTTSIKYGPHLSTVGEGTVRYLKAQHFSQDSVLEADAESFADPASGNLADALLSEDQIILASKGNRHFAWAYRAEVGPCIASSLFYVLTVKTELVVPAYLALRLNTASCGRALDAISLGATVPVIPKNELAHLAIAVPSLDEQKKLLRLHHLQSQRQHLLAELLHLTKTLDAARLEALLN